MKKQECGNCVFYYFDGNIGACRRYPPSMKSDTRGFKYPTPISYDWCGEWKEVKQ